MLSEAWHQHLANLTWWEEIDRFFNPAKYSCTTWQGCPGPLNLISILPYIIFGAVIISISLGFYIWWHERKIDSYNKTGE
jgi:hypothetical protein